MSEVPAIVPGWREVEPWRNRYRLRDRGRGWLAPRGCVESA